MIVRNPKRFTNRGSLLQAAAYVAFSFVTERKLLLHRNVSSKNDLIKTDTDVFISLFDNMEIHISKGILTEEMINSPKYCCILAYFLLSNRRPKPAAVETQESVEDIVICNLQNKKVHNAIGMLPEVQKRRIKMYFFDGMTYEEISARENCKHPAVVKSVKAALEKLRIILEG